MYALQYSCNILSFNKESLLYHTLLIYVLMAELDARGKLLHNIYYTPSSAGSFGGLKPLFREAKKQVKTLKLGDVSRWLSDQDAYTLHRPARIHFKRNKTVVSKIDDQWQADLVDMQQYARHNKGCKYILVCIDILSKYGWVKALKGKTGKEVARAFEAIFKQDGRKPDKIQTDRGGEFLNRPVSSLFKKCGIQHFVTNNEVKAGVVERFNRTLKTKMWRYFTANNTYRYVDVLPQFLKSYNHSLHRTIKCRPVDVNHHNDLLVWKRVYEPSVGTKKEVPKLRKGDRVRVSKRKGVFDKGYEQNFTTEIFIVDRVVKGTERPVYQLTDYDGDAIIGTFYPEELLKINDREDRLYRIEKILGTKGRGRRKLHLVKWLGWPSKFNSWVSASEVSEVV